MWLPGDILLKADKCAWPTAWSCACRFLDKKVMAFAETVPTRYRIRGTEVKAVLRHAANKNAAGRMGQPAEKGLPGAYPLLAAGEKMVCPCKAVFHRRVCSRIFLTQTPW